MGVKLCFFVAIIDSKNKELDLLDYYKNTENGHCLCSIQAREICSEFISRYFYKAEELPKLLLNKILEENFEKMDYEDAIKDMYNGIYKANIDNMIQDEDSHFEFRAYKDSKLVRNKLLLKYRDINLELTKNNIDAEVQLYLLLTL